MDTSKTRSEIDLTLDQLNKNAAALKEISSDCFYEIEAEALRRMQESLLARLLHLQEHLKEEKKPKPMKMQRCLEGVKPPPLAKKIKALAYSKARLKKNISI